MTDSNIRTELDADGVLLATIDMPGRAMNVFSQSLMDSLEKLVERAETDVSVRSVVLTSGKASFLAGADLEMIKMFAERARDGSTEELRKLFGHLGRLFRRLELNPKPFVAAINGLALGGGLEVCLACHGRIVADDPAIQLGLPEIKLGLLPGAGGTQRLPRLIGTSRGLQMLLTGEPVGPQEALGLGLVDEVVPPGEVIAAAKRRARSIARPAARWDEPDARFDAAPFDFSQPGYSTQVASAVGITPYQIEYYPAYSAIMGCVAGAWNQPMTEASEHEMSIFVDLMRDPVAGNMVRTLFLNRQKAAKLGLLAKDGPLSQGADALLPRVRAAAEALKGIEVSEQERLLALALAAVRVWDAGGIEAPELADVAVVQAGLFPSYAGGPFTYLGHMGLKAIDHAVRSAVKHDAQLFARPPGLARYFQPATAVPA